MNAKLFVRNLSWSVTENDLHDLFGEVGSVLSVSLPMRREDGRPRGIAFIEMATPEAAQKAIQKINGTMLYDRNIVVDFQNEDHSRGSSGSGGAPEKNTKLFIRGLSYSVSDQALQHHLEQAGMVISARVAMDRDTGESKGFGFVEMGSIADAQAAIDKLNNTLLEGKALIIGYSDPNRSNSKPRSGGYGGGGYNRSGGYGRDRSSGYSDRW